MMPGTGTGVVVKKRKGNHRFIMATPSSPPHQAAKASLQMVNDALE
jgi:hypothetical protein